MTLPTNLGYLGLALLVGGESLGLILPGETAILAAGVLAREGRLQIALVLPVAASGSPTRACLCREASGGHRKRSSHIHPGAGWSDPDKATDRRTMRERTILATAAALALVALAAIRNGALDAAAAVVLVLSLLLFVRAAFRLVDEIERREEQSGGQRRGSWRRRGRRA